MNDYNGLENFSSAIPSLSQIFSCPMHTSIEDMNTIIKELMFFLSSIALSFAHCPLVEIHNRHVPVQSKPFQPGPTKHCEPALSCSPLYNLSHPIFASSNTRLHRLHTPEPLSQSSHIQTPKKAASNHERDSPYDDVQFHQLRRPHHQHPPLRSRPHHLFPSPCRHLHPRRRQHDRPPL